MEQVLKSLHRRRASVQSRIDEERARPRPDHLRLSALKKLRLHFRDQIEVIERMNRQGQAVRVADVRRHPPLPLLPEGHEVVA